MKYMGSKRRIAKDILPIILKDRKEGQWYVEPFCGGCNSIDKVDGLRMANDSNEYLIEMWKALQNGWIPPEVVSEEMYCSVKNNKDEYPKELVGFVGFCCTFGSKWFGGYGRDSVGIRNCSKEGFRNIMKQVDNISGIIFTSVSYNDMPIPANSIIYCDPPYAGTTKYKDAFNSENLWLWCKERASEGHTVFVSEYNAPDWAECVWEKEIHSSLDANSGKKGVEKLYKIN